MASASLATAIAPTVSSRTGGLARPQPAVLARPPRSRALQAGRAATPRSALAVRPPTMHPIGGRLGPRMLAKRVPGRGKGGRGQDGPAAAPARSGDGTSAADADAATGEQPEAAAGALASGVQIAVLKRDLQAAIEDADYGYSGDESKERRIQELVDQLAQRTPRPEPMAKAGAIDGLWKSLHSTMMGERRMSRSTDLRQISFGKLAPVPIRMALEERTLQKVDSTDGSYINYIYFEPIGPRGVPGVCEVIGEFAPSADSPWRADVRFTRVVAYADGSDRGLEGQTRLREAYGLSPDAVLDASLGDRMRGWVDVTYVDDDLRIVRGNRGNTYILRKIGDVRFEYDGHTAHGQDASAAESAVHPPPRPSALDPSVSVAPEPFRRGYVSIADGPIHYLEAGPMDGPPLILLHQAPEDSSMWTEVLPLFASRGLRAIALDLPGFGMSYAPASPPEIGYYAAAALAAADALGLPRFDVLGHHLGASVALQMAADAPGRVRALALWGVPIMPDATREKLLKEPEPTYTSEKDFMDFWHLLHKDGILHPPTRPRVALRRMVEMLTTGPRRPWGHAAVARLDHRALLPRVAQPALCMAGDREILREGSQAAAEALPRAWMHWIDGAGIDVADSHGVDLVQAVADFLAEVGEAEDHGAAGGDGAPALRGDGADDVSGGDGGPDGA